MSEVNRSELHKINYVQGGVRAEEAAKAGLVFVQPAWKKTDGPFVMFGLGGWILVLLRLCFEVFWNKNSNAIVPMFLFWGGSVVLGLFVLLSRRMQEELWLSRGQIYYARRATRGAMRPVMSAQSVKNVDIVRVRAGRLHVDVIEIIGSEGIIHFGRAVDWMRLTKVVQQIRDWIESERGWALQPVFEESELEEELGKARTCGRYGCETWEGVDLARQSVLNWAWNKRAMSLWGTTPKRDLLTRVQRTTRTDFELPQSVRNAVSNIGLMGLVLLGLLWILLTCKGVWVAMVTPNFFLLLPLTPLMFGSVAVVWVLWIWMDVVFEKMQELAARK